MLTEKYLGRHPSHFKMNSIVKAFITSETLLWTGWNFATPIISIFVIKDVINGNIQIAASAISIYYIIRVMTELLFGNFFSKTNDKQKFLLSIFGIFLISLAYIGFSFTKTIPLLFTFYALTGVGLGIASPAKNALFSIHLDPGKEPTEWGVYDAFTFIGMALATALGGFIANQYGFHVLFIVSSIINFLSLIPYFLYIN